MREMETCMSWAGLGPNQNCSEVPSNVQPGCRMTAEKGGPALPAICLSQAAFQLH